MCCVCVQILCDPPYEKVDETRRVLKSLRDAHRRWSLSLSLSRALSFTLSLSHTHSLSLHTGVLMRGVVLRGEWVLCVSNALATHEQHMSNTLATHSQKLSNTLATH